jgi:hypothetical protein
MSRQRKRHLGRMSLEETVLLGISELVSGAGSVYVEVQDHDNIQGLLVVVEVNPETAEAKVSDLREEVRCYLSRLRTASQNDRCLAEWSAVFEKNGKTIASASVHDRLPHAGVA